MARLLRRLALLGCLLAIACGDKPSNATPPLDSYYYPTGMAVRHLPPGCVSGTDGCRTQLLVVSSNYDLRYDAASGGTVIAVDVDQALAAASAPGAVSPLPLTPLGAVRIGSFGGTLALLDAETCPGWTGRTQALVASRSLMTLYRLDVDAAGALTCGEGCQVPLLPDLADPYGVTIACGMLPSAPGQAPSAQALAFVSYLRAPDYHGWLSRVDLAQADPAGTFLSPASRVDLLVGPTHQAFWDPASTRLYVTGRYAGPGYSPLRWISLATPGHVARTLNLEGAVRGAETRGFALSSDRTRAYVAMRLYDEDAAASIGARPNADIGGALAILDATELSFGEPGMRVLRLVPLDRGASELRLLPRPGRRDLVAVTSSDDATLTLYDDEVEEVARVYALCGTSLDGSDAGVPAPCLPGEPLLGIQPFGLVVDPLPSGLARVYVGSFDRGFVNVLDLDAANPAAAPRRWVRIGPERP